MKLHIEMTINMTKQQYEDQKDEIAAFIKDSLQWAGGCRDPEDPMFHSLPKPKNVKITVIKGKSTS